MAIFERLRAADLIGYATPLFCWDFFPHMKLLIDRQLECLVMSLGALISAGVPERGPPRAANRNLGPADGG